MAAAPPLPFDEALRILRSLAPLTEQRRLVVVGGQAVAFWAHELGRLGYVAPTISEPLTSKDLDFRGSADTVKRSARLLGGEARLPAFDDHTPNTGVVVFRDSLGVRRTIDFLDAPYGLTTRDVLRTAVEVSFEDVEEGAVPVWLMHPERCLESRVHNIAGLGIKSELSLAQLRAAIACTRAFSAYVLDSPELGQRAAVRAVLEINERVFRFCRHRNARHVLREHGVDPFDAVLFENTRLPRQFRDRRYPQMTEHLASRPERRRGDSIG